MFMTRYVLGAMEAVVVLLGVGIMTGQFHIPQAQDSVPAQVLMACGADYPTYVLNPLAQREPIDDRTQHTVGIAGGQSVVKTVTDDAAGAAE